MESPPPSSLTLTEGVGWTCGRLSPSSVVSGAPALTGVTASGSTPFVSHFLGSLTLTEGVGFEPTWSDGPTP